ncbi:flagellar hook-associated protein FlgL [Clostridium sp. CCUG 7971]|uniref:flagellar hook-associated protein FlgL n=1 Tax=Clostridium sp. CCUG 7971 TaxID=2811414 RepID=UPI001ABBC885|nr:flagellar hook-associated protein FlgL [Clostridium sp. CCUG 7971]MBO3445062.1 flagellar hook-associated protein FlgL [Clostridium sp. CCUG 7971]
MRINTNMNAMIALNQMGKNVGLSGKSMNKLSSGERINKAGDDAAGLAISEKMRSQLRGLEQASRNTQDGISVVQTAEGAMEEVGNIAQRMRELSVQSANETNTGEDRAKITEELSQLHDEINRIADSTEFNKKNLLNGTDSIGKTIDVKLEAATADKFSVDGIKELGLKGDVALTTSAGTGSGSKISLKVGADTFELDKVGTDTTGKVKAGDYTLKKASGETIKLTIKEDMAAAAAATKIAVASEAATKIAVASEADIKGQSINLQVGANTTDSQKLNVKVQNVSTETLGLGTDKKAIEKMNKEGNDGTVAAKAMIDSLDKALETINTSRANLGATQNRLETAQSNLSTSSENLTAAESRIRDVDVAKEMMNLSKLNLLTQASQAMMAQAKAQPEGVMQLLR